MISVIRMLNQAKDVLDWYDNYKLTVPKWYRKAVKKGKQLWKDS